MATTFTIEQDKVTPALDNVLNDLVELWPDEIRISTCWQIVCGTDRAGQVIASLLEPGDPEPDIKKKTEARQLAENAIARLKAKEKPGGKAKTNGKEKTCPECGTKFTGRSKHCSKNCYQKEYMRNYKKETKSVEKPGDDGASTRPEYPGSSARSI